MVSGLWGCAAAWAQSPTATAAQAQAREEGPAGPGWLADARRIFGQSVDQLGRREMWVESAYWRVAVSPYTHHWRYSAEHRPVYALALERQRDDGWLMGVAPFRNSFGQGSLYTYLGRRFDNLFEQPQLFAQVSGGVLYGYRGSYQHKVPLNIRGFAPGALVSGGWRAESGFSTTLHLLGDAGVMVQFAFDFR